jgi:hypothetical protein
MHSIGLYGTEVIPMVRDILAGTKVKQRVGSL